MTAFASPPSSFDRVLATLRRLWPFEFTLTRSAGAAPAAADSKLGMELGSIAWIFARVADRVEAMLVELFPDTADESITRWEKVASTASNFAAATSSRQERVLSVLRRVADIQFTSLHNMLYGILGLDSPEDVQIFEVDRGQIEAGLAIESGIINQAITGVPTELTLTLPPFPDVIDDYGVMLYLSVDSYAGPTVTLTSPAGTVWNVPVEPDSPIEHYFINREDFADEDARGVWTMSIADSGSLVLYEWAIIASNAIDSGQIYNTFAFVDPALSPSPDIREAQRLFNRTALAHLNPKVITAEEFIVDTSLVDREPVDF
jgi:hypothetical protein